MPLSPTSVYLLGRDGHLVAVHGAPTNATIAQIFGCSTSRCWAGLCSSATSSAASWACGWAATCTTPLGSYDIVWGHRHWAGCAGGAGEPAHQWKHHPAGTAASGVSNALFLPPWLHIPTAHPPPVAARAGLFATIVACLAVFAMYTVPDFMVMVADKGGRVFDFKHFLASIA